MEELQPEEIKDLLKELEEEHGGEEAFYREARDDAFQCLEEAYASEARDEFETALAKCDLAIQLSPGLAEAHNLRGIILEELGRTQEAVAAYREAVRLAPDSAETRENLKGLEAELKIRGWLRPYESAAAESALQQDLDLREMASGAPIQRRIYPQLRIQRRGPVSVIGGLVFVVGGIAGIVAIALPAYKSDCASGLFVTVVLGGFAYGGFNAIGLDLLEIVRALPHRREWRGLQVTTDGRIVDLESKESRFEGEVFVTYLTTFVFSGPGGLVYLMATVDRSTFFQLRRGDPVKVRYAVENPRLALLEWEE